MFTWLVLYTFLEKKKINYTTVACSTMGHHWAMYSGKTLPSAGCSQTWPHDSGFQYSGTTLGSVLGKGTTIRWLLTDLPDGLALGERFLGHCDVLPSGHSGPERKTRSATRATNKFS